MSAPALSSRELDILRLMGEGLTNKEIARQLVIGSETVKWHNKHIFAELDVYSRSEAVARAKSLGLLKPNAGQPASPSPPLPSNNLPAQVTSFVGRRSELAALTQLLSQSRLLTLTGPGGSGKTRLALQAAAQLLPTFGDGVFFVPLAAVPTADQLLWAVADCLHIQFDAQGEPLKQLLGYFQQKNLLLVLDNFEHLVAGARLLTEVLNAAPAVKVLVTSRERLGLYGEANYTIEGLTLPEEKGGEGVAQSDAMQLFLQRAQAVSSNLNGQLNDLEPIVRICRLVGGMPLGIELAATWVDTLFPQEIADEIEHNLDILEAERPDLPTSQHSIRATFNRSWDLLAETQRAAFRRLSVFRGGFTREAGAAVAGITLRALQALVNKSLLFRDPHTGRYAIHELLRHYAAEQLELSGEADELYRAHATYFAGFMAERWPWMKGSRQKIALEEMEADIENARAAWHYWVKERDVAQLKKMLHGLWVIYDVRGRYPAGIELFEQGVQVMRSVATSEAEACLGWLLMVQGLFSVPVWSYDDQRVGATPLWLAEHGIYSVSGVAGPERGLALAQVGLQILRRLGRHDEMMIVPLISLFSIVSQLPHEEAISLQAAQDCLDLATDLDDRWAIAKAKQFLATRAIEDGEYDRSDRLAHEALTAFAASGDNWSTSIVCIEVLGLLAITLRHLDAAKEYIRRGLEAAEAIDFRYSIQTAYWQLGFVAMLDEKYAEAGAYWQKAMAVGDHMLGGRSFVGFVRSRGMAWSGYKLTKPQSE